MLGPLLLINKHGWDQEHLAYASFLGCGWIKEGNLLIDYALKTDK